MLLRQQKVQRLISDLTETVKSEQPEVMRRMRPAA
jgi:hypothetical protein